MASTSSSLVSLSSFSSASHFSGQTVNGSPSRPPPTCVKFRPVLRVSAAAGCAATAERPTKPHYIVPTAPSSLYEVLGVQAGATCQEIKAAYRRLARVLHPDVAAATSQKEENTGHEFMRVHEAYATLSDPEKRADYDRRQQLKPVGFPFSMSVSASAIRTSGYGRTWETDQCW